MCNFFKISPFFEQGCILGKKDELVDSVFFDKGNNKEGEYEPNIDILNNVLNDWFDKDIEFIGMAHSHPNGLLLMSDADEKYMRELGKINDMDKLYFLIVSYDCDSKFLVKVYTLLDHEGDILEEDLIII